MTDDDLIDDETYEAAQIYLKNMLEYGVATGRNPRAFNKFILDNYGNSLFPYLQKFLSDVHKGHIEIKGLTR